MLLVISPVHVHHQVIIIVINTKITIIVSIIVIIIVVTIILGIYLFLAAGCIDIITMNHSPAATGRLAKKYNLASTTGDLYVIMTLPVKLTV